MTPTATPAAMPTLANIRFNMILDHTKTNIVLLGWRGVANSHTNCSANSIPYLSCALLGEAAGSSKSNFFIPT